MRWGVMRHYGKSQAGISVVELLVVVAMFTGLATVALPRFAGLDEASRLEAISDLAAEIRSQAELSHAIWISAGQPPTLIHNNETVVLVDGYPSADAMSLLLVGDTLFEYDGGRYHYAAGGKAVPNCHVSYVPPPMGESRPRISAVVEGC